MGEVKLYEVTGEIKKGKFKTPFTKLIKGMGPKDIVEKIYCEFGSRHKAKRSEVNIFKIEEASERV
ncbi:TPA: 50S ribosomal protein L18a [Candidatus Bathyarchaeota archaeon]|nr:50S ribosomal protein L18a [Candidatus Bathyarchaeota archaeon]